MLPIKTAFLLIALIKTPGEGGAIDREFATLAECEAAGARIEAVFGAMDAGHGVAPKVLWACIEPQE